MWLCLQSESKRTLAKNHPLQKPTPCKKPRILASSWIVGNNVLHDITGNAQRQSNIFLGCIGRGGSRLQVASRLCTFRKERGYVCLKVLSPAFRQSPIRNFLLAVPCLPTHLSILYRRCNLDAIEQICNKILLFLSIQKKNHFTSVHCL